MFAYQSFPLRQDSAARRSGRQAASAVRSRLDAVELRVLAALGHEFLMCPDFSETGAVEHDDEIGHAHGGKAMRHEDRDTPAVVGRRAVRLFALACRRR